MRTLSRPQPDDARLAGLRDRCLDWIESRGEGFAPLDRQGRDLDVDRFKATVELALACAVARGWPAGADVRRKWSRCAEPALEFFRLPEGLQAFLTRHVEVAGAAWIGRWLLESFEQEVPPAFPDRRVVEELLRTRGSYPFEELEAAFLAAKLYGVQAPSASLWRRSLAASLPRAEAIRVRDAYSVTHAIFYVTAWGAAIPEFVEPELAGLRALVRGLGTRFAGERNADLVAELVLCDQLLGARDRRDDWNREMWDLLERAAGADGGVEPALEEDPGDEGDFLRRYHSTLAVALTASHAAAGGYAVV